MQCDLKKLVCVGEIIGSHGIKGGLRVRSFTAPAAQFFTYPLQDASGALVPLVKRGNDPKPDLFIAELPTVKSREAADALRGTQLYVDRVALPPVTADEYYLNDLIGLRTRHVSGEDYGRVFAVHNFGAGPILEIKPQGSKSGTTLLLPFTDEFVPTVDLAGGLVTIIMPIEVMGEPGHDGNPD